VESELIHSLLFTLQNSGECRRQTKEKEKGKGKSNAAVGTTEAVVKGSCSPLMDDGPSFFPLFLLFSFALSYGLLSTKINRVET
jgi:hypothetical protein